MGFIDSYKRLEKLCSEIYNDKHGVSSYIDEMINTPIGARYVPGWNDDLKKLKHYRWLRNKIVHDPGCTEENMCEYGDSQWIDDFHSQIMVGSDPLTRYRKACNFQQSRNTHEPRNHTYPQHTSTSQKSAGCLTYVIGILVVIVAVALIVSTFN